MHIHVLTSLKGLNCESLVSHCVPNPCLNNGTCASWDNGYICHCSENYIGNDCQGQLYINHHNTIIDAFDFT